MSISSRVVNLEKAFSKSIDQFDRTHKQVNHIEKIVTRNGNRIDVGIIISGDINKTTSDTNTAVTKIETIQAQIANKVLK